MKRFFRLLTPKTRKETAFGMAFSLSLIVLFEFLFQSFLMFDRWAFGVIIMHGVFVGGPFIILFYAVGNSQLRKLRELSLRSRKDGLTGLNNRHTFLEMANRRLSDQPISVLLLLDADHFKNVNDTYGHAVGDICLAAIANHLQWSLREDDVAGRLGGEEFAILIAGATLAQGRAIGERMTRPIPYSGGVDHPYLSITLSVGAAEASPGISLDRLLVRADEALYDAKNAGRGCLKTWVKKDSAAAA